MPLHFLICPIKLLVNTAALWAQTNDILFGCNLGEFLEVSDYRLGLIPVAYNHLASDKGTLPCGLLEETILQWVWTNQSKVDCAGNSRIERQVMAYLVMIRNPTTKGRRKKSYYFSR